MAGRKDGKPARRRGGAKVKRTVGLSAEASGRLDLHALGTGRSVGDVVESLVLAHCRRFVLQDRERGAEAAPQGPGPEGEGRAGAA